MNHGQHVPLVPVILAGGEGTRLWPLARAQYPKQFLPLVSDKTMLQETVLRLRGIPGIAEPLVICNETHRFTAAAQLAEAGIASPFVMLEPCERNTAPAIAAAALCLCGKTGGDPLMVVLAADSAFQDPEAFRKTVASAVEPALAGRLVTFGIVPSRPETGYGYIKAGKDSGAGWFALDSFREKPDAETAAAYLREGGYFWNSGMFLFRASVYLSELEKFAPDMLAAVRAAVEKMAGDSVSGTQDFHRLDAAEFSRCPADSIDYAVMEKTALGAVVPMDAGWSDVGSFDSLWEISPKDADGNAVRGNVLVHNSSGSLVFSEKRLVAAVGCRDLVVVETRDAVLVADKNASQDIKRVVAVLKERNRSEVDDPQVGFRPWGCYDSIEKGSRYRVKHITVKPGGKLSLQLHHHRSEHWIIVSGTARVRKGDEIMLMTENQSVFIPVGMLHSLENPGKIPLDVIEVQSGAYLEEDDITRVEDEYGRC